LEPLLKIWQFFLFFVPLSKYGHFVTFFFTKNHLYESYPIFCHKEAEKFTPKKKKKKKPVVAARIGQLKNAQQSALCRRNGASTHKHTTMDGCCMKWF
jgi:hypothetical protein